MRGGTWVCSGVPGGETGGVKRNGEGIERGEKTGEAGSRSGGGSGGGLRRRSCRCAGVPMSGKKLKEGVVFKNVATAHGLVQREFMVSVVAKFGHSKM